METIYSLPRFKRLAPSTPWAGGRVSDTDILSLTEAVRTAKKHTEIDINEQDFLHAAARGEILLRAIVHCQLTMTPVRGSDSPLFIPSDSIPTLPLDACLGLANVGKAEWRHIDDFEPAEIFGGELSRFKRWVLPNSEQSIFTTIGDCRVTGYDVHALADAMTINSIKNIEVNAVLAEFVNNLSEIDWQQWIDGSEILRHSQAIPLMCGLLPDTFANGTRKKNRNDVRRPHAKAKEMITLAEAQGKLVSTAEQWRDWALEHRFDVHDGFSIAVHESNKRTEGRYRLDEAAKAIADYAFEEEVAVLGKLCRAVESGALPTYKPLSNLRTEYGNEIGQLSRVRPYHEEVYWNDLNKWIATNEQKITIHFPNPKYGRELQEDEGEYTSLKNAIEPYINLSLDELPMPIRQKVSRDANLRYWNNINVVARREFAIYWDYEHDPANEQQREYDWVNLPTTLDALYWWNLPSITTEQAAMLLVQLNPRQNDIEIAKSTRNNETDSEDFVKLLTAFESLERVDTQPRTLSDWLEYAQKLNLKVHSWIFAYETHYKKIFTPAISNSTEEPHIYRNEMQKKAIIKWIREKGYLPQKLPKNEPGKPGVKSLIKKDMLNNKKLFTEKSFEKAWEALRSAKEIQNF